MMLPILAKIASDASEERLRKKLTGEFEKKQKDYKKERIENIAEHSKNRSSELEKEINEMEHEKEKEKEKIRKETDKKLKEAAEVKRIQKEEFSNRILDVETYHEKEAARKMQELKLRNEGRKKELYEETQDINRKLDQTNDDYNEIHQEQYNEKMDNVRGTEELQKQLRAENQNAEDKRSAERAEVDNKNLKQLLQLEKNFTDKETACNRQNDMIRIENNKSIFESHHNAVTLTIANMKDKDIGDVNSLIDQVKRSCEEVKTYFDNCYVIMFPNISDEESDPPKMSVDVCKTLKVHLKNLNNKQLSGFTGEIIDLESKLIRIPDQEKRNELINRLKDVKTIINELSRCINEFRSDLNGNCTNWSQKKAANFLEIMERISTEVNNIPMLERIDLAEMVGKMSERDGRNQNKALQYNF